jgi:hypothetical protein
MTIAPDRDLFVAKTLSRIQDHPRALNIAVGERRRSRAPRKLTTILLAKLDRVAAGPGHDLSFDTAQHPPLHNPTNFWMRPLVGLR